jgi:hypothetical protein
LPAPTDEDVSAILADVAKRIRRVLVAQGVFDPEDTPSWMLEEGPLVQCCEGSLAGRAVFGGRSGDRPRALGRTREARWQPMHGHLCAQHEGFSLHAGVAVAAGQREKLERLCRYLLRPALSHQRLELLEHGHVRLQLKTAWNDGTTHLQFTAWELMERLAALIPRPRANLVRYHGVWAPNSKWRSAVVGPREEAAATESKPASGKRHWIAWSDLLRRVFELDVLKCPDCGGRCRILGVIEADHQPDVVAKIRDAV